MPVERIRFFRCHLTEQAAQALVEQDIEALKSAFPKAYLNSDIAILRERFAAEGVVGCIAWTRVDADIMTRRNIDTWLSIYHTAKRIESDSLYDHH